MLTWLTHVTIRFLDWLAERMLSPDGTSGHQRTGRRGEEDAYFYLRHLGYIMVARNFRSPRRRGEIDLIGWDNDVLCFIEVKTRTTRDVKPAKPPWMAISSAPWPPSPAIISPGSPLFRSGALTWSPCIMTNARPSRSLRCSRILHAVK